METEPKRKRRWFQFSLRTLMIGVTLLAVPLGYVGWQAKIAKRRMAMYHELYNYSKENKRIGMICDEWTPDPEGVGRARSGTVPRLVIASIGDFAPDSDRPSAFRRWLGDPDIVMRVICFSEDAPKADIDEAAYLFPTATLYRVGGPQNAETATQVR